MLSIEKKIDYVVPISVTYSFHMKIMICKTFNDLENVNYFFSNTILITSVSFVRFVSKHKVCSICI